MQKNNVHILSTVSLGKDLVNEAAQNDIIIDEISFINTEAINNGAVGQRIHELAGQKITVVFTSMNAIDAVSKHIRTKITSWKIFCTGNTTKK